MIPEFLAFRYQGVRRIDEILAKPTDLGWKCRKYIRWRQVHNSDADAKALYAFAEDLIQKGKFRKDLYGAISAVCLNVQKWRLDKENLSVDPPLRKEWGRRYVLFKAAQTNPSIISARLSEQHLKCDTLSNVGIQTLFYASEIDSFLQTQKIEGYPADSVSALLLSGKEADFTRKLQDRFRSAYTFFGLSPPKATDSRHLLLQVAADLGFESILLNPEIPIPTSTERPDLGAIVEIVPLEKFRLVVIDSASGIEHIKLNSKHPFIQGILVQGKLHPTLEIFLRAYASCTLRMAGSIDTLETFNSYLGLDLYNVRIPNSNPQ